jgi:hypothetical protein
MDDQKHAIDFHQCLLRFIKDWASLHAFIDGGCSKFYKTYDQLKKNKVTFPPPIKPPRKSLEEDKKRQDKKSKPSEDEAKGLILTIKSSVGQWQKDKRIKSKFLGMIKDIQLRVVKEIESGNDKLISLNENLLALPELMEFACRNDQTAIDQIMQMQSNAEPNIIKKSQYESNIGGPNAILNSASTNYATNAFANPMQDKPEEEKAKKPQLIHEVRKEEFAYDSVLYKY